MMTDSYVHCIAVFYPISGTIDFNPVRVDLDAEVAEKAPRAYWHELEINYELVARI
jgi:hypothetical protein